MQNETYIERIKELRKYSGISQTQLSKKIGVSKSTIRYWELGSTVPSANSLIALAKYFDVTADYLLGLSDE